MTNLIKQTGFRVALSFLMTGLRSDTDMPFFCVLCLLNNRLHLASKVSSVRHRTLPSVRHRTTWTGVNGRGSNQRRYFNQIDFVLIPQRLRRRLIQARSYHGHTFSSDHAIVVATLNLAQAFRCPRTQGRTRCSDDIEDRPKVIGDDKDLRVLVTNPERTCDYAERVSVAMGAHSTGQRLPATAHLSRLRNSVCSAISSLPAKPPRLHGRVEYSTDSLIQEWSRQQKDLRLAIERKAPQSSQNTIRDLRRLRHSVVRAIKKRLQVLRNQRIASIAQELNATPDSQRRFQAARLLRRQTHQPFTLLDEHHNCSTQPAKLIELVADHYRAFFNPAGLQPVDMWGSHHGGLLHPITTAEVAQAKGKLRNGRACGDDGIPAELLKYGGTGVDEMLTIAFNQSLIHREVLPALGSGLLVPLNKPGKSNTVDNVRPLTLLTTTRKVFSLIVLERILPAVEGFIDSRQCGFRRGRSSCEISWFYQWIRAISHRSRRAIEIMGIDMSKAFDCVDRGKFLFILEGLVDIDSQRMARMLMAGTTLRVVTRGKLGKAFPTTMGCPQGDGLSPVIFTVYLEAAMREVRALDCALYSHHIGEFSYADDVDFVSESRPQLQNLLPTLVDVFSTYRLKVNPSKTEERTVTSDTKAPIAYKKLGAHLGPAESVRYRKQQAELAFRTMWKTWISARYISVANRVQMYNACVKPMLLYNIAAEALTECQLRSLEATHRKHLRILLRVFWPDRMTNAEVYRRTGERNIRLEILRLRWTFFQRAIQLNVGSPTWVAMHVYFKQGVSNLKVRGQPTLLPQLLKKEAQMMGASLNSWNDLERWCITPPSEWKKGIDILGTRYAATLEQSEHERARKRRRRVDLCVERQRQRLAEAKVLRQAQVERWNQARASEQVVGRGGPQQAASTRELRILSPSGHHLLVHHRGKRILWSVTAPPALGQQAKRIRLTHGGVSVVIGGSPSTPPRSPETPVRTSSLRSPPRISRGPRRTRTAMKEGTGRTIDERRIRRTARTSDDASIMHGRDR